MRVNCPLTSQQKARNDSSQKGLRHSRKGLFIIQYGASVADWVPSGCRNGKPCARPADEIRCEAKRRDQIKSLQSEKFREGCDAASFAKATACQEGRSHSWCRRHACRHRKGTVANGREELALF